MTCLTWIASNVALAGLVAVGAWTAQRLRRPGVARALWVLALVKLVTPPLVSVPVGEASGATACALGVCTCGPHPGAPTFLRFTLPGVLLVAWSVGAGATLVVAWRRWTHFRRLLVHASPAPARWRRLAARLARELRLRRPPFVLLIPGRLPPMVVPGWRGPRLLVPQGLIRQLSAAQRESLVLHELVHIKRGDHLVRLLELAAGVAFWWLPLVGSIGRRLRACEEACCDAAVVARRPRARRDYARLLMDVMDFADPLPAHSLPQVTAMSAADGLERRLRSILDAREATRPSRAAAVVMGLAIVMLPCGVHYELGGRDAANQASGGKNVAEVPAAMTSDECEPPVAARWAGCEPPVELTPMGCPSYPTP
jgi:beta-lactamase regulating signal transducer with metallopeptidase domain